MERSLPGPRVRVEWISPTARASTGCGPLNLYVLDDSCRAQGQRMAEAFGATHLSRDRSRGSGVGQGAASRSAGVG